MALRTMACLTVTICCTLALAQDPGTKAEPPVSTRNVDSTPQASTARSMAREWLSKKGWVRGENPDGAFVAIGTAAFNAKETRGSLARSNAFQLAALKAKNELAEFLSPRVATAVGGMLREGKIPADDAGVPKDVVQLLEEGVRASGGDQTGVLNSSEFASAVRAACRAEVAGSSISNTFETDDSAGNGAFAVVMRFTATSRQAASAAVGNGPAPRNANLPDAREWVKGLSESDLYRSFGARLMRTGADEVCVVAFGQANALGKSDNAFDIAAEKAKLAALGELRIFIGELVSSEATLSRRASIRELAAEGSAVDYYDGEGFAKMMVSRTQGLEFQGVRPIRDWEGKASGQNPSCGVAIMWSVSGSEAANALRKQMEAVGGSAGGSGRRDVAPGSQAPAVAPSGTDRNLPPIKPGNSGPDTPEP